MMCNNYECGCRERVSCLGVIGLLLALLLTFSIGLILGALFAGLIFSALAAIAVLAVVFFILLVIWAIVYFCRRRCD